MAESKDLGLFIGKMNIVNNRDAEFIEDEAKTVSFEAMGGDCDDIQKLICKWYERKDQTQFNKDEYTYLGAFKNKKGLIFDNVV